MSSKPRIGFLGLGAMGKPMAMNLLKAGYPLTVWNRSIEKTVEFAALEVRIGKSPAHVAAEVDIVITMVSAPQDVEAVVCGPDGVADGIKPGSVLIDMSTVSPETSCKLAGTLAAGGAEFVDAPVAGSVGPATEGTLVILAGGLPNTVERVRPILDVMGKKVIYAGENGKGSALKLATNLMLAHITAGFAEALLLVERSGIDSERFLDVMDNAAFATPWFRSKGQAMLARNFASHFALKHMHKDLKLMLDQAEDTQTPLPVTEAIEKLYTLCAAAGQNDIDYSSVLQFLENNAPEQPRTTLQ